MSNWIESLKEEVRSVTDNSIEQWAEVVKNMGLEGDDRRKWKKAVIENVTSLFTDIVEEVEGLQEKLTTKITGMLKKCEEYCKDLATPMPAFGEKKLSLYDECTILEQKIAELENTLELRKQRYKALRKKLHELCTLLGIEIPKHEQEIVYSEAFLSSLESHVETLETTKYERIERFLALQGRITDLLEELKLQPQLTFQKKLLDVKDPVGMLKESDLKNVAEYYESLQNQAEDMRAEIEQLRTKIEDLWGTFNLDIQERHLLRQKFVGNSFETLRVLKDEVRRCEDIRKANMQKFVENLRSELLALWDKCHCSDEERDSFPYFYSDNYNEDLFLLHEIEVKKLKERYTENSELYQSLEQYQRLWAQLLELEEKAANPDRFKNRGGQLLVEEKERNKVSRLIPKLEVQLKDRSTAYYENNRKVFLFDGLTVDEYIRRAHENREEERQRKLSARKQAREHLTITPGKSTLSLFPSSSTQNLATVSGNKRLIATPLTSARKRTKLDFGTRKRAALKPPTSEEKPKLKGLKAMKRHRLSKSLELFPQKENEYAMFERDMQNKDAAARSTIFGDASRPVTPLAVPLRENTLRRTPTAPSMSRSPRKVNNKLTAVSDLKLIF